jgi:hypothetical protein
VHAANLDCALTFEQSEVKQMATFVFYLLVLSCSLFAAEKLPPKDLLIVAYDWKVGVTQRCDVQPYETPQAPILVCGKQIRDEWNHMNDVGKNVALRTSSQTMKVTFPNPMLQMKLRLL